ncbi:unnamed protein product [marine sediment metagenome]|uniref:Uncharacterized protein n=1 Tax=marine sediment metagenome TaxID=412755 RepID=X1RKV7_9ZZZZ
MLTVKQQKALDILAEYEAELVRQTEILIQDGRKSLARCLKPQALKQLEDLAYKGCYTQRR